MGNDGAPGLRYLHTDPLGSLVAQTNASQTVTQRYHYQPYGKRLEPLLSDPAMRVTPRIRAARLHAGALLRSAARAILSTDPVDADPVTGGNFNRYAYANGNPYRYNDPSGRYGTDVPDQEDVAGDVAAMARHLHHCPHSATIWTRRLDAGGNGPVGLEVTGAERAGAAVRTSWARR